MSASRIQLVDNRTAKPIEAFLHDELTADVLLQTESLWFPARMQAMSRLAQASGAAAVPEHWHWNWGQKASRLQLLAYRCFGIECEGQVQGLMMVSTIGHASRLDPDVGKALVYVDYVESAPWNVKLLTPNPIYGGIGVQMVLAAVRFSRREGFHGRIGLHSLPQAERFYGKVCQMEDLGPDAAYAVPLRYFEFNRNQANAFLLKGGEQP